MEKEPRNMGKTPEQCRYEITGTLIGAFMGIMAVLVASGSANDDYNPPPTAHEYQGSVLTRTVNRFVDQHRVETVVFFAVSGAAAGCTVSRFGNNDSSGEK